MLSVIIDLFKNSLNLVLYLKSFRICLKLMITLAATLAAANTEFKLHRPSKLSFELNLNPQSNSKNKVTSNRVVVKRSINETEYDDRLQALELQCGASLPMEQEMDESSGSSSREDNLMIYKKLSEYFELQSGPFDRTINKQVVNFEDKSNATSSSSKRLAQLPRPLNVTVLIISWYPPILKLTWNLLDDFRLINSKLIRLRGENASNQSKKSEAENLLATRINKEETGDETNLPEPEVDGDETAILKEFKITKELLENSLTCFQVTYNVINSKFKITEEYPPYLRSISMERLAPATQYSLRVVAVYLNGKYKRFSDRVTFITPTDNESRRFKENTYRPIQRYPDVEQRQLKYGLAQVRNEEMFIVAIAILFWIASICLFFNKWGKIRMLEPYQPAYREVPSNPSSAVGLAAAGSGTVIGPPPAAAAAGAVATAANVTPSASVMAHHASLHNLQGAGSQANSGQAPPSAEQQPVSSAALCPIPGGAGKFCADEQTMTNKPVCNQPGIDVLLNSFTRRSEGTLLASRKLNLEHTSGLNLSKQQQQLKRFDAALASAEKQLIPASAIQMRRAETLSAAPMDLSYSLFQAKAQALAKATSLWSKQQQFRSRMSSQSRFPELELLAGVNHHHHSGKLAGLSKPTSAWRQSSQLLQQQLQSRLPQQQQDSLELAGAAKLESQDSCGGGSGSEERRSAQKSLDSCSLSLEKRLYEDDEEDEEGSVATSGQPQQRKPFECRDRGPGLLLKSKSGSSGPSRHLFRHRRQERAIEFSASKSLDQQHQQSQQSIQSKQQEEEQQQQREHHQQAEVQKPDHLALKSTSSNKLKRLLFISKTHQHHHIATSTSSSTLIQARDEQQQSEQVGAGLTRATMQSRFTGSSLDSNYSEALRSGQRTNSAASERSENLIKPNQMAKIIIHADSSNDYELERTIDMEHPFSGSATGSSRPNSSGYCEGAGSGLLGQVQKHHILIEPPSPPPANPLEPETSGARALDHSRGHRSQDEGIVCCSKVASEEEEQQQQLEHSLDYTACLRGRRQTNPSQYDGSRDEFGQVRGSAYSLGRKRSSSAHNQMIGSSRLDLGAQFRQQQQYHSFGLCSAGRNLGQRQENFSSADRSVSSDSFVKLASYQQQQKLAAAERDQQIIFQEQQQQHCFHCNQHHFQQSQAGIPQQQQFHPIGSRAPRDEEEHWKYQMQRNQQQQSLATEQDSLNLDGNQAACLLETRPRLSSVVGPAPPYSRAHRDSFAMLRALSQKKSKSAEDVAYLSSLVLQIWTRDKNPLLQSASSQQQLADQRRRRSSHQMQQPHREDNSSRAKKRPKSSLTVANLC